MHLPTVVVFLSSLLLFTTDVQADESRCDGLHRMPDVTIIYTDFVAGDAESTAHCYVKGLISGSTTFHVQLPADENWNGRLVHLGDGGADGDLDFYEMLGFLEEGYALVNSNAGHDAGAEPADYAYRDERSARDFAYWAVHTSATAAKSIVRHYYGRPQEYAYHYGCSTGGRQALAAAQLFPFDFDGILAGAPAHRQFERMAHRLNLEQALFEEDFAANLAFDADGDGAQESLAKVGLLGDIVTASCDVADGIEDGIIDPELCDFDVDRDLGSYQCPRGTDAESCFTPDQIASIKLIYEGSRNSRGELVYPGAPLGSEPTWGAVYIPHAGNNFVPYILRSASAVIAYSFYKDDPGLLPPDLSDTNYELDKDAALPEWGWWEFDIDDVGTEKMSAQSAIMRADDPDLDRFFHRNGGKLLMFHGWADAVIPPQPSLEYRQSVIDHVFDGDSEKASDHLQLYMGPGVYHCFGGPGPDRANYLAVLRAWVEDGDKPTQVTVRHFTDGQVDNERILCPYPQRAVFSGEPGTENDPASWKAENFSCR